MQSISQTRSTDLAIPVVADDLIEFHAARLLLLLRFCGTSGRIEGLTKMAKLDFFVRYPNFFAEAERELGVATSSDTNVQEGSVESNMVRFHYGPWDLRYYDVLAYLSARRLINVARSGETVVLRLNELGSQIADDIARSPAFEAVIAHMRAVKRVFGAKSGSALKDLIYRVFRREVAQRRLGEVIPGQ